MHNYNLLIRVHQFSLFPFCESELLGEKKNVFQQKCLRVHTCSETTFDKTGDIR